MQVFLFSTVPTNTISIIYEIQYIKFIYHIKQKPIDLIHRLPLRRTGINCRYTRLRFSPLYIWPDHGTPPTERGIQARCHLRPFIYYLETRVLRRAWSWMDSARWRAVDRYDSALLLLLFFDSHTEISHAAHASCRGIPAF